MIIDILLIVMKRPGLSFEKYDLSLIKSADRIGL